MNIGPLFWTPTIEGLYNYTDVIKSNEHLDNDFMAPRVARFNNY